MSRYIKFLAVATPLIAALLIALAYFIVDTRSPEAIARACKSDTNPSLCYLESIEDILKKEGLSAAFDMLAVAYEADPIFAKECHGNTHELGKAGYELFHINGTIELSDKASYCGFGFYHGFIEALIAETNDLSGARAFCRWAGENAQGSKSYAEGACYHGIGHGVVDGSDPHLWGDPATIISEGLALCRSVAKEESWLHRCYTGAFNSVALMYRDPKYKLDVGGDPYALCRTKGYDSMVARACVGQMDTLVAFITESDFTKGIAYARKVESEYRFDAIRQVASIIFLRYRDKGEDEIAQTISVGCGSIPEQERVACIDGIIDGTIEHGTPGEQHLQALSICRIIASTGIPNESCFERIALNLQSRFTGEEKIRLCDRVREDYPAAQCASG